jgi:3-phenylpropionate/trans-cinnamate dioxygenase ferredoxin subunit
LANTPPIDFVRVAAVEDVPSGSFVEIEIDDDVLILVNVDGEYRAVSAWCTHQGTSLALGTINGPVLTCYAHLWRYDVRNGDPIWPPLARVAPGYSLRTYPVLVDGNDIFVKRPRGTSTPR